MNEGTFVLKFEMAKTYVVILTSGDRLMLLISDFYFPMNCCMYIPVRYLAICDINRMLYTEY